MEMHQLDMSSMYSNHLHTDKVRMWSKQSIRSLGKASVLYVWERPEVNKSSKHGDVEKCLVLVFQLSAVWKLQVTCFLEEVFFFP